MRAGGVSRARERDRWSQTAWVGTQLCSHCCVAVGSFQISPGWTSPSVQWGLYWQPLHGVVVCRGPSSVPGRALPRRQVLLLDAVASLLCRVGGAGRGFSAGQAGGAGLLCCTGRDGPGEKRREHVKRCLAAQNTGGFYYRGRSLGVHMDTETEPTAGSFPDPWSPSPALFCFPGGPIPPGLCLSGRVVFWVLGSPSPPRWSDPADSPQLCLAGLITYLQYGQKPDITSLPFFLGRAGLLVQRGMVWSGGRFYFLPWHLPGRLQHWHVC